METKDRKYYTYLGIQILMVNFHTTLKLGVFSFSLLTEKYVLDFSNKGLLLQNLTINLGKFNS